MVLIIASLLPAQMIGVSLLAPPVPFRCQTGSFSISENLPSLSPNESLPGVSEADGANVTYYNEKCFPFLEHGAARLTAPNNTVPTDLPSCPFIEYDTSVFSSSIVSDYHLVCESFDQQALFQITYNTGGIMGSVIGGNIGDK
ncbi:solute carrier family 22 member 9-like isoform X2 [Eriocheir sinensis]|nr:solute carrier family 22 member 9-like isoform X2 [Eriocheir sinensis]